ncbi:MAG: gliding motility-associated C-terminal domain-containing protein [Elusimicrobia bacterium]|nr:gliding motility-associated C-terminal domain-containing protein [Elusimicrobiota bacterium]
MRRSATLALAALLFGAASPLSAGERLVGAGLGIKRNAVSAGGELATAAGASLNHAVAEASVSTFTGAGYKLYAGLLHLAAVPGSVTAIVAVSKSTGTLELSWTAPGLDGPRGNVSGGFYRIDASSDPLHVFDPSVYLTEFATGAAPGSTHAYTLSGLLPNTTYYSRVYLADTRKVFAENSAPGADSTLAHPPASPALSSVDASSVSFTWSLPAAGAEGFRIDSSSTAFGLLGPGGAVVSSRTDNGLSITLTVVGLTPNTTYFFRLGSLNWQGDYNFDTVIATRTALGPPIPIQSLAVTGDALARRVLLTWTNPAFRDPAGVLVQVSTQPIASGAVDGTAYAEGATLADGSVIRSTAAGSSFVDLGLELDTTRYFRLYSKNTSSEYSVHVATQVVLDLPPMAAAGLSASLSADGASVTLRWSSVASSLDGAPFKDPAAPHAWELDRFVVYRATGIVRSGWVQVGTAAVSATAFTDPLPDPSQRYYYKIVPTDAFSPLADSAMVLDTERNLYAVAPDRVSRLRIPPELAGAMLASGNRWGRDLLVRALEEPQNLGGRVVKSLRFETRTSPASAAAGLLFDGGQVDVALRYEVAGGIVVPSAASETLGPLAASPLSPAVPAAEAATRLAAYWDNGREYVKLFGRVDPADQLVTVQTAMPGGYQIRSVLREPAFTFDVSGTFNKAITPNGDGLNDAAVFVFDNPKDSAVRGRVFDLRGAHVSDMRAGPVANSLQWDGRAAGRAVSRGVYLYQIQAEGRTFNGTVLVVR